MSEQGAALQNYNQELVKYVEKLRNQSQQLQEKLDEEEINKNKLTEDMNALGVKLKESTTSINDMKKKKEECDRILAETECGLQKILETSEILLNVVQQEATSLEL